MAIIQGQQAVASDFVAMSTGSSDAGKAPKLNVNGVLDNSFLGLTGMIVPSMARTFPIGWLLCNGQAVGRSAFAALFDMLCPSAPVTISVTSPAVFTSNGHVLVAGDKIRFTTADTLPTGLLPNTDYYVISAGLNANEFRVSATRGGSAVNASGSQFGTHAWRAFNCGVGDGSTTFNLPNLKGRSVFGFDVSDANFDTLDTPNMYVGEKNHQLTVSELASHSHTPITWQDGSGGSSIPYVANSTTLTNNAATRSTPMSMATVGSNVAHNNMPPYRVVNFLIRT